MCDIWFIHQRPKYMAVYGWCLAMSGKFAPMISGLINVGMGWKWTLWWCSIFAAVGFVYCFLFLEETNYDRKHTMVPPAVGTPEHVAPMRDSDVGSMEKKTLGEVQPLDSEDRETGEIVWQRKTYWDKLGFKDKKRPNRLIPMMLAPFVGFTYAPVVYAGYVSMIQLSHSMTRSTNEWPRFMYGANSLVWQGVQNATIGTIYTTEYGFSTSSISAAYAGGVLGTIIG